jgi:hypothetical protein
MILLIYLEFTWWVVDGQYFVNKTYNLQICDHAIYWHTVGASITGQLRKIANLIHVNLMEKKKSDPGHPFRMFVLTKFAEKNGVRFIGTVR